MKKDIKACVYTLRGVYEALLTYTESPSVITPEMMQVIAIAVCSVIDDLESEA